MYHKVLIASDPEGLAVQTVPAVAALVRGTDAMVRVVAVEEAVARADTRDEGAAHLHRIVADLRRQGVSAEGVIQPSHRGHVADHLASAAARWGADLIVLGSHRRGEWRSLFVGSVGHALASRTRTPLLFIGAHPAEGSSAAPPSDWRNVLVAIDYDRASQRAIESAIEISVPKTHVHVVHAEALPDARWGQAYMPAEIMESEREQGHYLIEGALQTFLEHGIHASWEIIEPSGPVAQVIARAAGDFGADVIVLGSRRLPTAWALVAGSVAHDVIASTDRPVLLAGAQAETSETRIAETAAKPAVG